MDVKIETRGVNQLARAIKKVSDDLPAEMKQGYLDIATIVVESARSKMKKISHRASNSLAPKARARGASISAGGNKAPYYPWLDFGGTTGRGHRPGGGGVIKRPMIDGGRYIYPSIAEKSDEIKEATDELLERVAKSAGFDTKR